jgi:clorobiocin biosynthesis protein CloN4
VLTYRQLDADANDFARRLATAGVRRGDRVVIWSEKSARVVVAMQAVLRLGAVYVPADATVPAYRVTLMADDCQATVVCTTAQRIPELAATLVDLDAPLAHGEPVAHVESADDDPAYILYTSGSTGTPKGVCISHRNAEAFVDWAVTELAAGPTDRFANHASFGFDLSVLDLYAAFAVGASVHLIPAELAYAPDQLVKLLHERQITVWYSVPSALILMIRSGGLLADPAPAALRAVLFAGEPFPIAHVRRLAAWTDARLLNLYGPTETNVCTFHEVGPADLERDQPVPIGRACSGDRVWVENPSGAGEQGELVVDGPTVMLGYWGQPPQQGVYRTGDIVRVLADGGFDYVGRVDHMVKVRGHRIELGEIEAVIASHSDVDDVAVVVEGTGELARLTAVIVPVAGRDPGLISLKRHCAHRLPKYMIVDEIRMVDALPRTPNGKVDRSRLAENRSHTREATSS